MLWNYLAIDPYERLVLAAGLVARALCGVADPSHHQRALPLTPTADPITASKRADSPCRNARLTATKRPTHLRWGGGPSPAGPRPRPAGLHGAAVREHHRPDDGQPQPRAPAPLPVRSTGPRRNGSNSSATRSAAISGPDDATRARPAARRARCDLQPPAGTLCRTAFSSRLPTTRSSSAGSPWAGAGAVCSSTRSRARSRRPARPRARAPPGRRGPRGARTPSRRRLGAGQQQQAGRGRRPGAVASRTTSPIRRSSSTSAAGSDSVTSTSVRITDSGVRSSWLALATNRRCASNAACSRSSMSSKLAASSATSSRASRSRCGCPATPPTAAAPSPVSVQRAEHPPDQQPGQQRAGQHQQRERDQPRRAAPSSRPPRRSRPATCSDATTRSPTCTWVPGGNGGSRATPADQQLAQRQQQRADQRHHAVDSSVSRGRRPHRRGPGPRTGGAARRADARGAGRPGSPHPPRCRSPRARRASCATSSRSPARWW